ncbi:helix-turn-helix domain-containing protein [Paraburkholderia rhizosphaerae]|uniref:AraC-like DNA-binding protein n=1 Tax=Paraburkholderia rhizosphaerae TaxID=480658 RepID=A0A4R8LMP4_9BURK|nr:helix-turn-helix domain-containing protein [Paraburkholderia rhizosphaerae]TDY45416.1 AraC-like DNA-binding protein [Paraburkholderia rhizosphaerae]
MDSGFYETSWDGAPQGRPAWIDRVSTQGMSCRVDAYRSGASSFTFAGAGQTGIINVNLAWQSVSPATRCDASNWNGEHLFVKVVKSGTMSIEQRGQTTTFGPGDIAVVDPLHTFNESFCEPTRVSILRMPKSALRERGLRHQFAAICCPNPASADVVAVRGFVLNLASLAGHASDALLARLGEQCLDLMDVLVNDRDGPATGRTSAATVLRAKQVIARRIGDPELSVVSLAAELNISISCLTRALKASGLSPMRHAWAMRVEHAAQLLARAPQGAIQDVAYQCGFASAAHFSRAFKERYGMTPREYAASHKTSRGGAARPNVNGSPDSAG